MAKTVLCQHCGEALNANWKLCPVCETPLEARRCPQCGIAVKANWKRCPECETLLICTDCGQRLPQGYSQCPACDGTAHGTAVGGDTIIEPITQMELVMIPGGSFQMGDLFGDGAANENPVHEVRVKPFYLAKYQITQDQWQTVMGNNPAQFRKGGRFPIEQVSWADVQLFLQRLQELNAGRYGFRLPTEVQWEYAARSGGRQELYAGGDDIDAVAWYEDNSNGSTHPVGQKKANGLGLYDMSGNVWEWCNDGYADAAYERYAARRPAADSRDDERVIRGGSWHLDAWSVRCSRRIGFRIDYFGAGLGFRLVCMP